MMEQNPARPARKVNVADHIWQAFEEMAQQMGTDRDGLVNQAMFMFARLNGFMDAASNGAGPALASPGAGPGRATGRGGNPPMLAPVPSKEEPAARSPSRASPPVPSSSGERANSRLDEDPVRREVAERVLETAAELERLIKGKNESKDVTGEEPAEEEGAAEEAPAAEGDDAPGLYLMAEGGELDRIVKDRFIIGRGKHCDFVINSGKVSREHAAITREGGEFFIEDLGSSNGTWFNKQRIKRRKVENGDEYFICSEKIKLVMR